MFDVRGSMFECSRFDVRGSRLNVNRVQGPIVSCQLPIIKVPVPRNPVPSTHSQLTTHHSLFLRYRADSNCCKRFCRPLPSHSATVPKFF